MEYTPHYVEFLKKAGVRYSLLPMQILVLIEKYESAETALLKSNPEVQLQLLPVLVKADAYICALINSSSETKEVPQHDIPKKDNDLEQMRLKAAELLKKWGK